MSKSLTLLHTHTHAHISWFPTQDTINANGGLWVERERERETEKSKKLDFSCGEPISFLLSTLRHDIKKGGNRERESAIACPRKSERVRTHARTHTQARERKKA